MEIKEAISWTSEWQLDKFKDPDGKIGEFLQKGGSIEEAIKKFGNHLKTEKWEGNLGLQEGRQELIDIICGLGTPTKWDNTNARLGVGDSNTAPAETQTGLQAAVNKSWKGMDATYPQRSAQTAEWRATWGAAEKLDTPTYTTLKEVTDSFGLTDAVLRNQTLVHSCRFDGSKRSSFKGQAFASGFRFNGVK